MSAVGLTKARQRALEAWKRGGCVQLRMLTSLMDDGLAQYVAGEPLTPRGHAALAAPRMTVSQLALLEFLSTRSSARVTGAQWNVACNLKNSGFVVVALRDDRAYADITPSGLKALNDVRAAMGSELWKDMP